MFSTKLKTYLEESGSVFTEHRHFPAYTAQEIAQTLRVPGRQMLKTVILKTDDERMIMAVLSANDAVKLESLREQLGCTVLRLALESEFRNSFPTCNPGAIPPFGNIFNMPVYCEASLFRSDEIEFSAGTYDETIRMRSDDYRRLVNPNVTHFAQPRADGVPRIAA